MDTQTQIDIYELDNIDVSVGASPKPMLSVKNDDIRTKMVYIEIDGKKAKVLGHELIRAIQNAIN